MAERDRYSRRELLGPRAAASGLRWCLGLVRQATQAAGAAFVGGGGASAAGLPPPECSTRPVLRPPGAHGERRFLELCSRCGACIQACPYGVLVPLADGDPAGAGTPAVQPLDRGCEYCDDPPCMRACPTGALHPDLPRRMGTARISGHCLNRHGHPCRECHDQCPVAGAIVLVDGVPEIVPERCVGCGICCQVCPAPINAIILRPAERPEEP